MSDQKPRFTYITKLVTKGANGGISHMSSHYDPLSSIANQLHMYRSQMTEDTIRKMLLSQGVDPDALIGEIAAEPIDPGIPQSFILDLILERKGIRIETVTNLTTQKDSVRVWKLVDEVDTGFDLGALMKGVDANGTQGE